MNSFTNSDSTLAGSARTRANADLAYNLDHRLRKAAVRYFWSHGIYVDAYDARTALNDIEDPVLSSALQPQLKESI